MKTITRLYPYIISLCIITGVKASYADEHETHQILLILGDSLSAGYGLKQGVNWTDRLQKKINTGSKKIQLVNASISGDTTDNGLNRLPEALKQYQPEWVLIELGANDGLRGLSITHIRRNLERLIQISLNANAKVLLMEIKIPPNYGKKYTQAFNSIYHKLAKQYQLTLIPFMLNDMIINSELMQADGLHPNEKAQELISKHLWQILRPVLYQRSHES